MDNSNSSASDLATSASVMSMSPPNGSPKNQQLSLQQQQQHQIVQVGFEEGTLRALCDLDCGFPLLMDRIKQSMASCRVSSWPEIHQGDQQSILIIPI